MGEMVKALGSSFGRPLLAPSTKSSSNSSSRPSLHKSPLLCTPRASGVTPIMLHFGETSIKLPLSRGAAKGLDSAIRAVLTTFSEKEKMARPRRWDNMEFQNVEDGVSIEFFCNPNAFANAFQAKVLVTVSDDKMTVTTEGRLSSLKSEVDQFLQVNC